MASRTNCVALRKWVLLTALYLSVSSALGATSEPSPATEETTPLMTDTLQDDEDYEGSGFGLEEVLETSHVTRKNLTCYKCSKTKGAKDCTKPMNKCENATKCFKYWNTDYYGTSIWERGCLYDTPHHQLFFWWCRSNAPKPDRIWDDNRMVMDCCDEGDLCNKGNITWLPPRPPPLPPPPPKDHVDLWFYWTFIGAFFILIILFNVFLWWCLPKKNLCRNRNRDSATKTDVTSGGNTDLEKGRPADQSKKAEPPQQITKTHGSSPPIVEGITLHHRIGSGRFTVKKGVLEGGKEVAVKIFPTHGYASFEVEAEIYNLLEPLKHENILRFYGTKEVGGQRWILTEYQKLGNLYYYLMEHSLTLEEAVGMAHSLAKGLAVLHNQNIAHRDLKSVNVLVSEHKTCIISDFELSLIIKPPDSREMRSHLREVGTRRLMAPEILDESIDTHDPDTFKRADIYAAALIIWEMVQRIETQDVKAQAYQIPYYDTVIHRDPKKEHMKEAVCVEGCRPKFADAWTSHKVIGPIVSLTKKCWDANPGLRKTAAEMEAELEKVLNSLTISTDIPEKFEIL